MEQQTTTFWLATATSDGNAELIGTTNVESDDQQDKNGDLSAMFNQPTVMNFATIFAGASAAVASSGANNMVNGQRVPPLSQIGISPSKRTTLVPINNLHSVPSINQLAPLPQPQVASTSTVVVNSLNNITPLTTTLYTLPLPSEPIQVPKNFIQQAAAASGLTASSGGNPVVNNDVLISPQCMQRVNGGTSIPATPQISEAAMPMSNSPIQTITLQTAMPTAYQCTECSKTFESSGQLSYHTFVAHGELQARPHKCTACPESFLMDHHLRDHMRAIHLSPNQGGGPPFSCSECMTSFTDGGHLNFHLYMNHTIQGSKPAQQQYPCPDCGKVFIKSSLRSAHIRNVHSGQIYALVSPNQIQVSNAENKLHKCSQCQKGFKTQSYLKQHVMSVHDKPLKCAVCKRGFGRKSDLKRHMRGVHMKKRPHLCTKCGWTFSEVSNLKHHLQAVHQKEKNFRCMYCDKTFSLSSYLRTHLIRMHNINLDNVKTPETLEQGETIPLSAPTETPTTQPAVIGVANSNSNTIALQTLQISIPQTHVSRCYECGQTFQNAQLLQNHVMSTHSQPFWCTVCGEAFALASQLQLHLQLRHTSNEPQTNTIQTVQAVDLQTNGEIALEIRETTISTPQEISSQQLSMTSQQQNVTSQPNLVVSAQPQPATNISLSPVGHKCNICGAVYDTCPDEHICWKRVATDSESFTLVEPDRRRHTQLSAVSAISVNDISIGTDRPHSCNECGKGFKTATHLKQHIRCVHSKERPHKCQQCQKCFARTSDLNRHVKGVHQRLKNIRSTVFVTLKCSECGAIYAETSQLKRHIYTHHLRGRPSYKCADCQEGFTDETSFQNHICHEDERPHECSVCSKRFQMLQQLRRHMRAAHGRQTDEPQNHKCFQCERIFGRPIDLERHIQAVHLREKPHKCSLCGKSFGLQGNLNKHVRAVHLLEKPHQCIECGKRFAHVGVLKRHLRDIHFYDKKASVKEKLAQMQIKNTRALMRNIANMQSSAMLTDDQVEQLQPQQDQQHLKMTAMSQTNTVQLQQQTMQTMNRPTDLPTIDNIATISRQQQQQQPTNTQTQVVQQLVQTTQMQSDNQQRMVTA